MISPKYILLILPLCAILSCATSNPEVNTTTGCIKGSVKSYKGTTIYQYMGIPFAEAPVGDLRFRKTVPLTGWSGVVNATVTPPACSQYYPFDYPIMDQLPGKSEDCLYLNMWVPGDACPEDPKAVMVWLFGGGYTTGSNRLSSYNGTVYAAKGDVIVVTPNYRLGIFGFLYSDSEKAQGNMGLYDVLEALKWVKKNIAAFGGDKSKVTLAGNSAGSLISGLFTISPIAEGLFQRVIMGSGADIPMRGDIKQYNLQLGQQVATEAGCASQSVTLQDNPDQVIDCLKNKTADELVTATYIIIKTATFSFRPIYGDELIPEPPSEGYENAQNVSVIIGDVKDPGTFYLATVYADIFGPYDEKKPVINKTYGTQLLDEVLTNINIDSNGRNQIINYYLSAVPNNDTYRIRQQLARAVGDVIIFCNDYYFAVEFSQRVPVYYFYFIHRTLTTQFAEWAGVTVFSEVPYFFGIPINDDQFTDEEAQLSKKMVHNGANYIKYGVPSSDWKVFNGSESRPYVQILKADGDVNAEPYENFNSCEFLRPFLLNNESD